MNGRHCETGLEALAENPCGARCDSCAFGVPGMIPDPNAQWCKSMSRKPRVPGIRCHAARPNANGFPSLLPGDFCGWWTERGTERQPLRRLVDYAPMGAAREGVRHGA